jgi:hypothetical protein
MGFSTMWAAGAAYSCGLPSRDGCGTPVTRAVLPVIFI